MSLSRETASIALSVLAGEALTQAVGFSQWAGGVVIVPAEWTAANIGFYVSDIESGEYVILRDDSGSAVEITSIKTDGSRAYKLPDDVFGCTFLKLWSKNTASEADVNQAAVRALKVLCKS